MLPLIAINADVRRGNSGGPLLDEHGNVIGVVFAKINSVSVFEKTGALIRNIGFALPMEFILPFLDSHGVRYKTNQASRRISWDELLSNTKPYKALSIRQLAFRFAVTWNGEHPGLDPEFEVTSDMRIEFLALLRSEGVELDDDLFDSVQNLVDRFLAVQLANIAFGELEALRRSQREERQVLEAVDRLIEAASVEDLLDAVADDRDNTATQPAASATG